MSRDERGHIRSDSIHKASKIKEVTRLANLTIRKAEVMVSIQDGRLSRWNKRASPLPITPNAPVGSTCFIIHAWQPNCFREFDIIKRRVVHADLLFLLNQVDNPRSINR